MAKRQTAFGPEPIPVQVSGRAFYIEGSLKRDIPIGIVYSQSGSYARISEACRKGALNAIARINADPDRQITLIPYQRDPAGNVDLYAPMCDDILRNTPARHIVGCVTSWSRKEVIPTLEKHGGTLWYTVPYEGFEASDHVVYLHSCPNQHLLPLLAWAFPTFGRRCYLTGSNYIWGWEMNRLARETVAAAGGVVLGERYLPIGSVDVARMIDEVSASQPDFILNSLIGPSSYAFLQAYAELGRANPRFHPDRCPVLSCNLTECELEDIGDAANGVIAAGPYFQGDAERFANINSANLNFASSHEAAANRAVTLLAALLEHSPDAQNITDLLATPSGLQSGIDPRTHHTHQQVLIAKVEQGAFHVIHNGGSVAGDPYLTHDLPKTPRRLRVVS